MTAREYLEQYRQAQSKADALRTKYNELVASYGDVGGQVFTESRRAGISKPTERKVEKAQRVFEAWRAAQIHALEIRQNVYALIAALPSKESQIMIERYLERKTWAQIEAAGYTHGGVQRAHQHALQELQNLIDDGAIGEIEADLDAYIKRRINKWYHLT